MVALNETDSELGLRRAARGCRVTATYPQGGTGIAAGGVNFPGAAARTIFLGTGFRAADGTDGFGLPPNALNINGADTYQFVMSDPMSYSDPAGESVGGAIGGWVGGWVGGIVGGVVGGVGGGAEGAAAGTVVEPIGGTIVGGAVGAGVEGTAGADAGSAIGRGLGSALGNWLQGWFASKVQPAAKTKPGARGGSCSASGSPQKPGRDPEKWRRQGCEDET